jgi:ABC-type Fe2+-enterobactin transport system substrate-binding protein
LGCSSNEKKSSWESLLLSLGSASALQASAAHGITPFSDESVVQVSQTVLLFHRII